MRTDANKVLDVVRHVQDVLASHRVVVASEAALQEALAGLFVAEGIPAEREHVLAPGERVDFWWPAGVVLELKVAGKVTAILRQLQRYARHDDVRGLVLATTRRQHHHALQRLGGTVGGKPLLVVHLEGLF